MSGLLRRIDETPVSYVIALAYVTMAFLTDPMDPETADLVHYGAVRGFLVQEGELWRLIAHAFLHGGLIHLALNTFFLIQIGPMLEHRLGSVKFIVLYVITAVSGGVVGSLWHHPVAPLVGGSGALFGMLGSAVAINMRSGRHLLDFLDYHGPRQLLGLIAINLILGMFFSFVSNAAHIGGLVSGFALSFCFLERGRTGIDGAGRAIQAGWIALFLSAVFFCSFPVLRWDYLLTRTARADDPARARAYALALLTDNPRFLGVHVTRGDLTNPERLDELVQVLRNEYRILHARLKGS